MFLLSLVLITYSWYVYAVDSVALVFSSQSSSDLWSSNSVIYVDWNLSYINKGGNSSIIGNYFTGYYYDSVLGYFEVDKSSSESENVRITWSTWECSTWYGYKLWGYAYSDAFGYIDFDYDSNNFVYYCVSDESLHGYAYSTILWFQNFEGIDFDINVTPLILPEEPTGTGIFVNDTTEILDETPEVTEIDNSSFDYDSIQNDLLEFDGKYESLFYIIK